MALIQGTIADLRFRPPRRARLAGRGILDCQYQADQFAIPACTGRRVVWRFRAAGEHNPQSSGRCVG